MQDILEVYNNYKDLGIKNRTITQGKEIELVKEYIEFRKDTFTPSSNKKLAIFLEAKVDHAYPDIVFVEYNPENYVDWNNSRNNLCKEDLKVLYHIYHKKGIQIQELVSDLGFSWKKSSSIIETLCDSNLIERKDKKWSITDIKKISTYKIEAVEAKLNQWENVLQQSIINKNFASESYVLSVKKSKPKKETLSKFKKFGIGIYLKNGDNFDTLRIAKKSDIPVNFNSIYFNECIGRILNSKGGF